MKKLSQVWFLHPPIDFEYKNYVLLDFIQSIELELSEEKIYSPLKKIIFCIKSLEHFKKTGLILINDLIELTKKDFDVIDSYTGKMEESESIELERIIDNSLQILFEKSRVLLNKWEKIESKIKIFNLENLRPDGKSGIIIFRSTLTNEIFPHKWERTKINFGPEEKNGIIMKEVFVTNPYFSMSYEYIIHEVLYSIGIRNGSKIQCTIVEISDSFDSESEIYKIAKDKIISELNYPLEI
jgi:hypothetical protein